jgi:hypothetical protein
MSDALIQVLCGSPAKQETSPSDVRTHVSGRAETVCKKAVSVFIFF